MKMWSLILVASFFTLLPANIQAGLIHSSGFQPSLGIAGLDYNVHPVPAPAIPPSYDAAKEACALVLDGPGQSTLYDHTQSIFFGAA